jgi:transmembrane sensor
MSGWSLIAPGNNYSEPDPLLREAISWVVRLHSGEATSEDADTIQQWRSQSPEHEQAFRDAVKLWRSLGDAVRTLGSPAQVPSAIRKPAGRVLTRRRALIGGALAASAAGYLVVRPPFGIWPSLQELSADYRTSKGEQRNVVLSDNVSLKLNTQTSIAVRSSRTEPEIELISGEAAVVTRRDGKAPLVMVAGQGRIHAVRATFNARCLDGGVVAVSCLDGAVDVELNGQTARVPSDREISYSPSTGLGVSRSVNPAEATAWQDGLLIVRDRPLVNVIDEVNRYRSGKIIVMNPQLGNRMITGTFRLDELDGFVSQVRGLFGANARSLPGGIVLLT